jgi:hypothetical protein
MLTTFTDTLTSAEADAVCAPEYGARSPERTGLRVNQLKNWTMAGSILNDFLTGSSEPVTACEYFGPYLSIACQIAHKLLTEVQIIVRQPSLA